MKKEYVKPQILFCSFELSQDISAGCEVITNFAQDICALYPNEEGWENISIYSEATCSHTPPNPIAGDEPCYDIPVDSYNVYSS